MPCQACGVDDGLEVCLFCGRSFCSQHRGESGGVPACTTCLQAEAARKRSASSRSAPHESERLPTKAARPAPAAAPEVQVSEKPLAPLPEPKDRVKPLALGAAAAVLAGGYVHWMIPRIVESSEGAELSAWVYTAGPAAAVLVAFAGVWAIAKTKL